MSAMSDKTANKLSIVIIFAIIIMFFVFVHWIEGVRREHDQVKARILELQQQKAQSETNNNQPSATPKEQGDTP